MGLERLNDKMSKRARLLVACLVVLLSSVPARAQDSADHEYSQDRLASDADLNRSRAEIDQLGAERSAVGVRIADLELSAAEIESEMARLTDLAVVQNLYIENVAARQTLANEQYAAAGVALKRAEETYAGQRRLLTKRLVNMYIFSTEHRTALSWKVSDVTDLENRHVLLTMIGEHDKGLLERLDAAAAETAERRVALEALRHSIDAMAQEAAEALAQLTRVQDYQAQLHTELQARIAELHAEIAAIDAAQEAVEAILGARRNVIELEAADRDRLRRICYESPRQPVDSDGSWVDCPAVGVVIPPDAVRWPLNETVTSEYGQRWGRMHHGLDLSGDHGARIVAAESGRVHYAGWIGGYGSTVIIDHGGEMTTLYGHMDGLAVLVGQTVSMGQVVGYVGSSGHSTGPHLHFEVRINGEPVDPRNYLP